MNYGNAIPANGTKSNAMKTPLQRSGSVSQPPGKLGSAGAP